MAHASFPRDGRLRWLRWLDGIDVQAASGTPTILALLTLLPKDTNARSLPTLAEAAVSNEGLSAHPVHVGSLPGLRLGAVFHNGSHVGDLTMEASGAFAFGHSDEAAVVRADDENRAERPAWWKYAWIVLPVGRYPLARFSKSFCIQFLSAGCDLLVPCSEIFRVLCAPETRLANALLSGPWDTVVGSVMNETWNDQVEGFWTVGLRTGLTGRSAHAVAAYHWTAWGRQVAGAMKSVRMAGGQLSHLQAAVPYRFEGIEFEGEGVVLLDTGGLRRFLMLRIGAVRFLDGILDMPALIRYRLDNFNTPRSEGGAEPLPPITKKVPEPSPDPATGKVEVSPHEPPALASNPAVVRYPAAGIAGLPDTERLELEPPRSETDRRRRHIQREPVPVASTGRPWRGGGGVAALTHAEGARTGSAPGFAAMTLALDSLLASGVVGSWMPTVPANGPWAVVGGVEAWLLPLDIAGKPKGFARLRSGRRRACLVAEFEVAGRTCHLLELERQPAVEGSVFVEAFRFALLEVSTHGFEPAVSALLRGVAVAGGQWPRDFSAGRLTPIRHRYMPTNAEDVASKRVEIGWLAGKLSNFVSGTSA